jgi:hypothetical protein
VGVISIAELSHKLSAVSRKNSIWIALALTAVAATQIYYVREMLAALILFSVLFVAVYAVVLAIFLFVRVCRPFVAWAERNVARLEHLSVGAFKDAMASPVWARLVPSRSRSTEFFARARKPAIAWAAPKLDKLAHLSAGTLEDVLASPVWARAVPYRSHSQQLKRNVLTNIARLRSAARKPTRAYIAQVYVVGLRAGVVVVAIGSSLRRTVSTRLGPWLREPVTFRPLASPHGPGHLFLRIGRIASRHSRVFSRRPRTGRKAPLRSN